MTTLMLYVDMERLIMTLIGEGVFGKFMTRVGIIEFQERSTSSVPHYLDREEE